MKGVLVFSNMDPAPAAARYGFFLDPLRAELLNPFEDARYELTLLTRMRYYDMVTGEVVEVPAGFMSDGASLPRFSWTLIAHPLQREVRRAGVVHDLECRVQRPRTSTSAHQRFGRMLKVDGMGPRRAKILETAVRGFGPRWTREAA